MARGANCDSEFARFSVKAGLGTMQTIWGQIEPWIEVQQRDRNLDVGN